MADISYWSLPMGLRQSGTQRLHCRLDGILMPAFSPFPATFDLSVCFTRTDAVKLDKV